MSLSVVVQCSIDLVLVVFFDSEQFSLISAAEVIRCGIVGSVLEYGQNSVVSAELSEILATSFVIDSLHVRIEPDVFSSNGGYTFGFQ